MGNEIVKYDNDMNSVAFGKFKEKELDLFFSICFKVRDMGTKKVVLSFSELKELSNYSNRNLNRFIKDLSNTYDKMLGLNIKIMHSELSFTKFNLFSEYTVNVEEKTITIQVHEKFEYILNKMLKEGNYTKFELIEFVNLKSSYSKNMFKLLKQWEIKKERKFDISEFRNILDIPPKYRMSEIDKKILTPIMQELGQLFSNLKLEKIKTGRNVTGLKFSWSNTKLNSKLKNSEIIDIIEVSDKLNKVIEKVKKNRFIAPLLTIDNIEILVEMFQEKDLIKGLNWSYKEIKQEIKSLNYLIKSIKTGMEQKEKKLVVKSVPEVIQEQEILKENNLGLEKDQELKITEIEKIKITKDEYEELYKKFLQEQNTEHNLLTRKGFDIANKNKYEIVETEIEDKVYQFTIEELKKIPFEELIGKKVEIIANINSTEKRYMSYTKDPNDDNTILEITEEIFNLDKIPQEKLLSKTGKILTGGALYARLTKIAKDEGIKIQYGDEVINGKEGK
ncbi:replication initiation protein [Paraclostridium dentum]|uniref:replication initiation protein n=1 Tax=Paraclostridium dentum TaxID=2662455 RepID=UPI003F34CC35